MLNEDKCDILRGDAGVSMSVEELVVGDVFRFYTGMKVPADGVMIRGENVQCDESALSGESKPEAKKVLTEETMLEGGKSTMFAQSNVTMGSGLALVTAVGVSTKAG
jgi:Ca2+-transporting ATPase